MLYSMLVCRTKEKSTARVREVVLHILDIFPNANQIIRCVKFTDNFKNVNGDSKLTSSLPMPDDNEIITKRNLLI